MSDLVTDISVNKNWNLRKGDDNGITFTCLDQNNNPFDITGYVFSLQIRHFGVPSFNVLELTQGAGLTNNGVLGTLNALITAAQGAANFFYDFYYWQLTVVDPLNRTNRWFNGELNVYDEIYNGDSVSTISTTLDMGNQNITVQISLPVATALTGAWVNKGNYDASVNLFPSTVGILNGYAYQISVSGTLGGVFVPAGSTIVALTNTPGQVLSNWRIIF